MSRLMRNMVKYKQFFWNLDISTGLIRKKTLNMSALNSTKNPAQCLRRVFCGPKRDYQGHYPIFFLYQCATTKRNTSLPFGLWIANNL